MFAFVLLVFLSFNALLWCALACSTLVLLTLVSLYCAWLPCYGVAYICNVMPWPMVLCDAMQSLPIRFLCNTLSLSLDSGVLSSPCTDLLSAVMLFAALFLLYCNAWRCDPFEIPCYTFSYFAFDLVVSARFFWFGLCYGDLSWFGVPYLI